MILSILGTVFAICLLGLVWPWACARLYRHWELPESAILGILSAPLWFGWLLGLVVLVSPNGPLWAYTAVLVAVPAIIFLFVQKPQSGEPRPAFAFSLEALGLGGLLACLVGLLVFNTLVYPPWDHDVLIVHAFAARLRESWDFWALPRYEPDTLGFYYPLAHPPAMMSTMAWVSSFSPFGWAIRFPSAILLATSFLALYFAGEHMYRRAGYWAVLLLLSSGLYLFFVTNNSQDIFRYAGLIGALVVFPFALHNARAAVLAGALLGLSAAHHSLGLIFLVLLPGALWAAGFFRWSETKSAASMLLAGLLVALYPYAANYLKLGTVVIPTLQTSTPIPNVLAIVAPVQDAYARTQNLWDAWVSARLAMFTDFANWGFAGVAFLVALGFAVYLMVQRKMGSRDKAWMALIIASLGYLIVIIDPGDFLYSLTKKRLLVNIRYPLAMLPVLVLAGAAGVARLLRKWRVVAVLALLVGGYFLLQPTSRFFARDKKIRFEGELPCALCSDHEKLSGNLESASYRAVQWLGNLGDRKCLTFRDADYFAWSKNMGGVMYYHPIANHAFGATSPTEAHTYLQQEGVNCVFVENHSVTRQQLAKTSPGFAALATHPAVTPFEFYEMSVWMLDGPYDKPRLPNPPLPETAVNTFGISVTGVSAAELELVFEAARAVDIVAYFEQANGDKYRIYLGNRIEPGRLVIPFVNDVNGEKLHFWFGTAVSVSTLTLRSVSLPSAKR